MVRFQSLSRSDGQFVSLSLTGASDTNAGCILLYIFICISLFFYFSVGSFSSCAPNLLETPFVLQLFSKMVAKRNGDGYGRTGCE